MCARESLDAMRLRVAQTVERRHPAARPRDRRHRRARRVGRRRHNPCSCSCSSVSSSSSSIISKTWKRDYFDCNNAAALRVLLKMPDAKALSRRERHEVAMEGEGGCGGRTYLMEQMQKGNVETVQTLMSVLDERTRKELLQARDDNGSCCLHYAVYGASVESMACLEMLLLENEQYGGVLDMAAKDFQDESTPLILSAFTNNTFVIEKTLLLTGMNGQQEVLYERDKGNATIAGHLAQRARGDKGMKNVLAKVIALAGPGGCGKLKRGEKTYLMKNKEFSGQLNELDCEQLVYIINYWRLGFGKLNASAMTEKKKLIEIVLMATP